MECYVTKESLKGKTEEWLRKIESFNLHRMELKRERSALLVIDMQHFFLDPDSKAFICAGLSILPNVKGLIQAFRRANRPVIYTCHTHHPDGLDAGIMGWWWEEMCVEGTPESRVHKEIAPLEKEKIIFKHRYSAFYNTDLETFLRCLKIEDLVISGVMTNMCCESTTRDAYYRDYRVFFLTDGTAAINEEMHLASLLNLAYGFAYITKTDEILASL